MFESLSEIQREIVFNKSGKFVVRACPGSGKTYCVSARLARLINDWEKGYQGIAALSFTNVAWREIEYKYKEEFSVNQSISFPHFVGTIDSFINKYIFLPFGHLVMKCNKRPILVGEPYGSWSGGRHKRDYGQYFDKITFDIRGNLKSVSKDTRFFFGGWESAFAENKEPNGHYDNLLAMKNTFVLAGYANQSDANFFAMRILEHFPLIRQALVFRFPSLIVDEAQDTSDIQMKIIDLLAGNGLNEIMLVGDPDQAIFEWNGARPDLLKQKIIDWNNVVCLNENRRSSQKICNFTYKISSLDNPSKSVDCEIKDFNYQPIVRTYTNNLPEVVDSFLEVCKQNGIEVSDKTVSVLYRSKGMLNEIIGVQNIPFGVVHWNIQDKFTQDFARGKFVYDNGDYKQGFKLIEKAIYKMINNVSFCSEEMIDTLIEKIGFIRYRTNVFDYIKLLPKTNKNIGKWVDLVNNAFFTENIQYELNINRISRDYTFSQIFLNEDEFISRVNYRIGTVHSVKGETFDATLLVLKQRASNRGKYSNILKDKNPPSDHEELRIVYVGMTRPRKVLMLAVPDEECKSAWETKLLSIKEGDNYRLNF